MDFGNFRKRIPWPPKIEQKVFEKRFHGFPKFDEFGILFFIQKRETTHAYAATHTHTHTHTHKHTHTHTHT